MSDKSFGDHMSRGIVKNPLLSTAVTGLSIEDLTQNAVLLPVSRSQEPFGRQETETPAQFTPTPSGDTFTPIHPPDQNAQPKDDFDVNEYFARLQGTRYVSAPLNSHIESANANIEKEENLEEINLNEPINEGIQLQQSITADIAQNFSQLPTVLPQVASAVFSSFSNMLNMKRETPERQAPLQGASETQAGVREMGVPLVGVSERAPPLREPPTSGPGNFRLTTKKKYAQIPGLSSGEPAQMPTFTPPTFNQPIFTPPEPEIKDNVINTESIPTLNVGQTNVDFNAFSHMQNIPESRDNIYNILETPKQEANIVATLQFSQDSNTQAAIIPPPPMFSNLAKRDGLPNVGKTILPPSVARRIGSNKPTISNQTPAFAAIGNIFVPAPNAEELPQNISQTFSQSYLATNFPSSYTQEVSPPLIPMSIPILSSSTVSSTDVPPNVSFTSMALEATPQMDLSMTVSSTPATATGINTMGTLPPPPPKNIFSPSHVTVSGVAGSSIPGNLPPPPKNAFNTPPAMNLQTESLIIGSRPFTAQPAMESNTSAASVTSTGQSESVLASVTVLFTPGSHSQILAQPPPTIPQPTNIALFSNTASVASSSTSGILPQPHMRSANLLNLPNTNLSAQSEVTSQAPPQIFNPNEHVSLLSKDMTQDQIEQMLRPTEESRKIPEPPKASGNTNFRMMKKRPQYYSGPIEGVGAISNNVKPTLTPVPTTAFQGAVFTPETNTAYQTTVFTPENVTENITLSQEAISVPANINDHQQQIYNFTPVDVNQPSSSVNCTSSESVTSTYNYNTTFDLSRQAPDAYEPQTQESAFGIIGSLKSKLSSIDINKLQNSVTTFFDPGYNMVKTETVEKTQPAYGQNQGFEIFVANPDEKAQPYNYNAHQNNFTYGQGPIPNASDYYNQQVHNVYSTNSYYSQPSYGTESYIQTQIPVQEDYSENANNQMSAVNTEIPHGVNPWGSNESSTGYHQDHVLGVTHILAPVVNTESSEKATSWSAYDPASKCDDSSSAAGNFTVIPTSTVDTNSTQRNNIRSMVDLASISDKHHVADNSNISHEQTSYVEHDSSQKTNIWCTYGSSISNSPHNVEKNSNNTREPLSAVDAESRQNANLWGSYDLTSSSDDKYNVAEHKTGYERAFNQAQLGSNEPNMVEMPNVKNVAYAMKNLQIEEDENAKIEEVGLVEEQNVTSNSSSQPIFPYINDLSSPYFDENGEKKKSAVFNYVDMLQNPDMPEVPKAYIAPLQNPFRKRQEIFDGCSEGGDSWNSNEEEVDDQSAAERLLSLADEGSEDENLSMYESEPAENLDICVTCREFIQPEEEDEDLTHKLIKNITAPIQLSNPVEVPLTETDKIRTTPDQFDTVNQCAEISLIADETIETLQIKSATELLNEAENPNNESSYGWRAEAPLPPGADILDHDYTFKANPKAIGFFANNDLFFDNLPNYANIKTELNVQKETPIVFQSQMSIPSAPPAEDSDDAKSDETGVLDVQSIEQDATQDFPVLEEFVIEPSETEDDKIELNKNDEVKDTFTNRVERFKQLEGSEDATEQKETSNLAISDTKMSSYFDTGNYAVETHFKKSLTSPTIARIPPGFEDHYELMPSDRDKEYDIIKVPDTTTQTAVTTTVSNILTKNENLTSTVFSSMPPFTIESTHFQKPQSETKLGDFTSVFGAKIAFTEVNVTDAEKSIEPPKEHTPVYPQVHIEDKVQKTVTLPDPINFFGSSAQEPATAEGVNRLASYFAAPAKTENTKSFFELSQGQDHYRQSEGSKPFFELSQSQDHYKENIANIPHDKYIAHLNLMKDLTSCQNIEPNKEQIVRTINYFTLENDNDVLNFNKGEPSLNLIKESLNKEPTNSNNVNKDSKVEKEETILCDEMFVDIVNKCNYCNELKAESVFIRETGLDINQIRFRQAMDGGNSPKKGEVDMKPGKETERSVNVRMEDVASEGDNGEGVAMMTENRSSSEYEPVKHHWFYRVDCEDKSTWRGFSLTDSRAIENAFQSSTLSENTLVPTDGGRYDVNVMGRLRIAVYWSDKPTNVRRCSWFYKGTTDSRYVPYTESVAEKLEVEYRHGITTGEWHRRLVLPNNELVVMHGPAVMVHFLQAGTTDAFSAPNVEYRHGITTGEWQRRLVLPNNELVVMHGPAVMVHFLQAGTTDAFSAPNPLAIGRRVYRNPPRFKLSLDQPVKIDHLLFLVHGAGEWRCQKDKQSTMRPRVVRRGIDESEIEDTEPSSIDHLLLLCHGVGSACDMRFRPVEEVVDDFRATSLQLLQSHYRNSCDNGIVGRVEVLPISWHASLHSGPRGVDRRLARVTLASIPRLRNFTNDTVLDVLFYTSPHYCQMILDTVCGELNRIYTLFMSRNPDFKGRVSLGGHSLGSVILYDLLCNQPIPRNPVKTRTEKTYISGTAANNPTMQYPTLCFEPLALYALGSPIAIFECIRGVEMLGGEFYLPTCRNFFNIFHPYDPIAYRIEPLVNSQLQDVKPSLIPHHKGRKRMHLELKDTMARVGADLKQKLVESIKSTWSSMWPSAAPPDHQLEKVVEEEIEKEQIEEDSSKEEPVQADVTPGEMLGRLNNGRRVDYVLQEAPFEMINEYIFAMSSHVCYWESEDVMLLILREIYDSMGVQPDVTVPQQSLTVQRTTIVADGERIVTTDASTSRLA